ncbi:hypothetical protein TUSST3_14130 [Streptomyces sp. TUS-ST3]|uniref:hypothetical protein n=1 Tax=Streptomyces sp. TUS-ST3 TaxID=3025591 RepID=UPI00235B548D|nr:hypothetical protein [Streptomyces sp. TUS-ST3]GLP64793.1 hypothetical protein TUSST3_14130 [Streptomyces sp. TUS-ST3]
MSESTALPIGHEGIQARAGRLDRGSGARCGIRSGKEPFVLSTIVVVPDLDGMQPEVRDDGV